MRKLADVPPFERGVPWERWLFWEIASMCEAELIRVAAERARKPAGRAEPGPKRQAPVQVTLGEEWDQLA